jgi:predicted transcriptional regulator
MSNTPNPHDRLPSLELECMKALLRLGEANVHGIRASIWPKRPLAYTTVMTVMDRLARKGVVERRKQGRFHLYRPLISDTELRELALKRLLDEFFFGSREALRSYLKESDSKNAALASEVNPASEEQVDQAIPHEEAGAPASDADIEPSFRDLRSTTLISET